jgi:hypothetical protein
VSRNAGIGVSLGLTVGMLDSYLFIAQYLQRSDFGPGEGFWLLMASYVVLSLSMLAIRRDMIHTRVLTLWEKIAVVATTVLLFIGYYWGMGVGTSGEGPGNDDDLAAASDFIWSFVGLGATVILPVIAFRLAGWSLRMGALLGFAVSTIATQLFFLRSFYSYSDSVGLVEWVGFLALIALLILASRDDSTGQFSRKALS